MRTLSNHPARDVLVENGLFATHWGSIIDKAERRGEEFTKEEKEQADGWTTCACGRLKEDGIDRDEYGAPIDPELMQLGLVFNDNIKSGLPFLAAKTLLNIQNRAVELIREFKKAEAGRGNTR